MKIRFRTMKFANLRELFNVGWSVDDEADFSFCICFSGRDFSLDFYKKDSTWIDYYYQERN